MTRGPVLVIGDANVDVILEKPEGRTIANDRLEVVQGGAAANTAVGLARLGVPTAFAGMVGDDGFGRLLREALDRAGVATGLLRVHRTAATCQVIYALDAHGRIWANAAWPALLEAAPYRLAVSDIDEEAVRSAGWVHAVGLSLVGSPLREATLHVMRLAHEAGVPVSLDLNLRRLEEADAEAFHGALNEAIGWSNVVLGSGGDELAYLFPNVPADQAAAELARRGCTVVVRMAAQGAFAVLPGGERVTSTAFPVELVYPIGAGDAFNAGFIAARMWGTNVARALSWGNGVAALRISRSYHDASPERAEVEALLGAGLTPLAAGE